MIELKRKLPIYPDDDFEDDRLPKKTFSHSQYSSFKKCGRAYEFSYCEGLKIRPRGAMYKGSTIHSGAEFSLTEVIDKKKTPSLDEATSFVADTFEAKKETVEFWDEGETEGAAKDITLKLYRTYHEQGLPKMRPEQVEEPFAIRFGGTPVIGYIDLVDRVKIFDDAGDPGQRVLADLKYSGASWSQDEADREPQFTLYAHATGISKIRVDNLVPLKKGPEFKQKDSIRTTEQVLTLEEDYVSVVDMIMRGVFPMAPIDSWQCTQKWCGFWDRCRGRKR
jgi:hypothetical protein